MSEVSTQLWGIFFSGTKDIPNYICKKNQYGKNCPVKEHSFNLTQLPFIVNYQLCYYTS